MMRVVGVFQTRILTQTLTPIRGPLSVLALDRASMSTDIRIGNGVGPATRHGTVERSNPWRPRLIARVPEELIDAFADRGEQPEDPACAKQI